MQGLQHSLHKATSEVESLNSRLAEQTLESQNLRASIDQLQKDLVSLANEKTFYKLNYAQTRSVLLLQDQSFQLLVKRRLR